MCSMRLAIIGFIGCVLASCTPSPQYYITSGVNHTLYKVTYKANEPLDAEIEKAFKDYYHALNPFDSLSVISAVNTNKNMVVDSVFIKAFVAAADIAEQTDGTFDVTCAPLLNLWGFGFNKMDSISPRIIDSLRTFVGYDKVYLDGNKVVKKDPRVLLNFSALGDGYISDIIAELLERKGVENYLVYVGGEMRVRGMNPSGRQWDIGINKPIDDSTQVNEEVQFILNFPDPVGIATSGDYRNFYIKDGKKYAHTLNPHTGYPAGQDILSATVVAENCLVADAYATAFMVLGRENAKKLKLVHPELEYLFIYSDSLGNYEAEYSTGMYKYISEAGKRVLSD